MTAYKRTRRQLEKAADHVADRLNHDFHKSIDQSLRPGETATRLEALLAALFIFDYLLNQKQVPEELREGFLSDAFKHIAEQHKRLVASDDPLSTLEQRFNGYADHAINKGEGWFERFLPDFYHHLWGCKESGKVQTTYTLNNGVNNEAWHTFSRKAETTYQFTEHLINYILQQEQLFRAYRKANKAMGENPQPSNFCLLKTFLPFPQVLNFCRHIRDYRLKKSRAGQLVIGHYYRVSFLILRDRLSLPDKLKMTIFL